VEEYLSHVYEGNTRSCTAVFCKNWGLHVRKLGVCKYGYIYEYTRKICGYGYEYGWEISYPREACFLQLTGCYNVLIFC